MATLMFDLIIFEPVHSILLFDCFPSPPMNFIFFFLDVLLMLKLFWRSFYHLIKFCLYFGKAIKLALHHIHTRNSIPFTFAFVSLHYGKIRIKSNNKNRKDT